MGKRRTADQIKRVLQEADRDLAKGLTVGDVCRKLGVSENTYYRWRQRHNPAQVDGARRVRELEVELVPQGTFAERIRAVNRIRQCANANAFIQQSRRDIFAGITERASDDVEFRHYFLPGFRDFLTTPSDKSRDSTR